jgi:hypothetical protein
MPKKSKPPSPRAAKRAVGVIAVPDEAIESLNLSSKARKAAYNLKKAHPSIIFTSGRRSAQDQARAMAGNVIKNVRWIEETYLPSEVCTKCQEWVNIHRDKKTAEEVAAGLLTVFDTFSDTDLARFSRHLSGDAFDVQPVDKNAAAIKKTIRGLPEVDKFLEREGGLLRWHVQF